VDTLLDLALKEASRYARSGFVAAFVSGSLAAGDAWAGSDVDFYLVSPEEEHAPFRSEIYERDGVLFNPHFISIGTLRRLLLDKEHFVRSHVPEQLYRALRAFDDDGRASDIVRRISALYFAPGMQARRLDRLARKAVTALDAARRALSNREPLRACYWAQKCAHYAARLVIAGEREVPRSARRYPERFRRTLDRSRCEFSYEDWLWTTGLDVTLDEARAYLFEEIPLVRRDFTELVRGFARAYPYALPDDLRSIVAGRGRHPMMRKPAALFTPCLDEGYPSGLVFVNRHDVVERLPFEIARMYELGPGRRVDAFHLHGFSSLRGTTRRLVGSFVRMQRLRSAAGEVRDAVRLASETCAEAVSGYVRDARRSR